ncbi:MAG: acyl carrier protein [Proteobacteria bacterium]|nr:acyl carrier protein [Pseudomonadota bacterium]MBU1686390.1 acyl carrier protein [Pseudomonadota bacterium]
MNELERELLEMICEVCKIKDEHSVIDPTLPLIGPESPLGIDSLDAVEIVFTVKNKYGVRIDSEETSSKVLSSLQSLAEFIRNKQ